jgi:hypothetical protein
MGEPIDVGVIGASRQQIIDGCLEGFNIMEDRYGFPRD